MKDQLYIFIFRRDLRIYDNFALIELYNMSKKNNIKILPIFIFNSKQIDPKINEYYSKNSVEFMVQCLEELNISLNNNLYYFHGDDIEILNKLLEKFQIHTIAWNSDYTPFSIKRDENISKWCKDKKIEVVTANDYMLLPFNEKKYQIFTPFYNDFLTKIKNIKNPENLNIPKKLIYDDRNKFKSLLVKNIHDYYNNNSNKYLEVKGGRQEALNIFQHIKRGNFKNYGNERNFPYLNKTTKLSAYIKFGCVSIRETYNIFKPNKDLTRELIFREFYANITWYYPKILQGQISDLKNEPFKEKYKDIRFNYREDWWNAFNNGKTGIPIVDAGIRQLLTTGFCHGRLRMILGSFFCKDMFFDWRLFEKWMCTHLVDYDPSSNNAGCQWCSSTGTDSSPYFRIFNPFLQSKKYDPNCEYIKYWIKELKDIPVKDIHNWEIEYIKYSNIQYPKPILDHKIQSRKAIDVFKNIK